MQVHSIKTRVETWKRLWSERVILEYHTLLSTIAFNVKLRRYIEGRVEIPAEVTLVGRCRLTASKLVFKSPMVSALEAST